ncbi:MAG: PKD domain-containing protein [Candidatus Methanoperedens sp.]|nr:PKD domain-containing protein [Candidatus Methanoperedens sp.]
MNKYTRILFALILLGDLVNSSRTALAESREPFPDEEWNRTYSVGEIYETQCIQKTSEGGYIIIGTLSKSSNDGRHPEDYLLVKTDPTGKEQWRRKFIEEDESRAGYAMNIMQTTDLGYLIAGSTANFTTGSLNIWISKLDAEGKEEWKKNLQENRSARQFFGGNKIMDRYDETYRSVREAPDGGFLILGKTDNCQNCSIQMERPMDIWLVKTDLNGNEEWNRTLGRTDHSAYSFIMTPDGGLVLAGVYGPDTTWFEKSDQNGNELWNRTYEGIGGGSVVVQRASDGGYAVAIAGTSESQIRLIKTDTNGFKQWEKTYMDTSFHDFQHTQDGGFLLWRSAWADNRLLKIDRDGNEQWRKNLDDLAVSYVEQTREGDYLLAATKFSEDVILGYTVRKLDYTGNKLWEKIFGNEFFGSPPVGKKTIAQTDDGYVLMGSGSNSLNIKLKKFKNRDIPFAVFTYEPEYPGVNQTVTFDASVSNDPKGNITNYRWDFGDGNTTITSAKKISHSYNRIGEMTVRLTVINNSGGVNSTWKKVFVQKLAAPFEILNVSFGNYSDAKYAEETSDGGFIIAGRNDSIYEGWLVKTDPDGKEEWNWTFNGNELKSVIQTEDGGFMAAGDNMSDIKLVKIDQKGKEQWYRTFKDKLIGPNLGFGLVFGENGTVAQTHEGGYVVAGINKWAAGDNMDAWLAKTDPEGNYSWSRILKGNRTGQNILSSVQETSDGGYIVTGTWWNPYGGLDPDAILIKTDQKGNEKWACTRIISLNDHAGPGLQTSDGGFVMMGTSSYLNQSNWTSYWTNYTGPQWNTDIWLMKTDAKGNEQWRKGNRVKGLAYEASLSATEDGGYIYSVMVQERPENDYEKTDVYREIYSAKFVKLDSDGNIEWQKRDEGYSIKPTSDGGYVTARGSSLVKFGWVKSEGSLGEIIPDETSANPNETPIAIPTRSSPEKAAGFEAVLSITMLLAVYTARRKSR